MVRWFLQAALAAEPSGDPAVDAVEAVVLVVQGSSTCAGALVDDLGTVATAYHCVASGGHPRVTARDGVYGVGEVISVDPRRDLALIRVHDLAGRPWLVVRDGAPAVGEVVSALGHPFGVLAPAGFLEGTLRWSLSQGVVSNVGPTAVQFTAAINPGNSGGPVVDEAGAVVAVVSRRTGGGEGLGFGGRADHLAVLMAESPARMGPLGGTIAILPILTVWQGEGGLFSAGGKVEIALRDRLVFGGAARWGLTPRLSALQFDEVAFLGPAGRVGLRQRFGRGRLALRMDAWGEAATLVSAEGEIAAGNVTINQDFAAAWLVGGQVQLGGAGFDLGVAPADGGWSASVVLTWPGVVGVF